MSETTLYLTTVRICKVGGPRKSNGCEHAYADEMGKVLQNIFVIADIHNRHRLANINKEGHQIQGAKYYVPDHPDLK